LEASLSKQSPEELALMLDQSISKNNEIIAALNAILADMIELQDLNEIIDRVRGLIDRESKLIDRSKQQQKKSNLDQLK
jgi:acetyl-CoA carboxylase alpha subunit